MKLKKGVIFSEFTKTSQLFAFHTIFYYNTAMKLLIIEDEKTLAESLKTLLESKHFEVDAVYDGKNGLAYALLGIYDLVILDVMLPKTLRPLRSRITVHPFPTVTRHKTNQEMSVSEMQQQIPPRLSQQPIQSIRFPKPDACLHNSYVFCICITGSPVKPMSF